MEIIPSLPMIDIWVTSPPYNIGYPNPDTAGTARKGVDYTSCNDCIPEGIYQKSQQDILETMYEKTTKGGSLFYIHQNRTKIPVIRKDNRGMTKKSGIFSSPLDWIRRTRWNIVQELVWDKGSSHQQNKARFTPIDERVWWLSKGKPEHNHNIILPTILRHPKPTSEERGPCPSPFPVNLIHQLLEAVAKPNDIICDPYMGSGTTLLVCKRMGLSGIGIEIDKETMAHAIKRIERESHDGAQSR